MFKINSKTIRTTSRRSEVFIVNFETYVTPFSSVSIGAFVQVNISWEVT